MSAEPAGASADISEVHALVGLARALVGALTDERQAGALIARSLADLIGDGVSVSVIPADRTELVRIAAVHHDQLAHEPAANGTGPSASPSIAAWPGGAAVAVSAGALITAERCAGLRPPRSGSGSNGGSRGSRGTRGSRGQVPLADLTPWADRYGITDHAILPLRIQERTAGIITITRDHNSPPYTEREIMLAQALVDIAAVSMEIGRMLVNSTTALEELRQQNELINDVSDAIIACDETCAIVNWSSAAERMYLYEEGEALGCDLFTLLGTIFTTGDGQPVSREEVLQRLRVQGNWRGSLRERRADGRQVEALTSMTALTGADGRVSGMLSVNRDVTEQRQKEHLASHDPLTGLPNRRGLYEQLTMALERCHEDGAALGVLFFDLDRFKPINDTLGHEAGDEALCRTAERLSAALPPQGLVTRLGGDEFVVISEGLAGPEEAESLAHRLLQAISRPMALAGKPVSITASVGVVVTHTPPAGTETPDMLLRVADQAMYEAKQTRAKITFAGQRPPDFTI